MIDICVSVTGLWGGVIILGNAPVQNGPLQVEGFNPSAKTQFGGSNTADNSGILSYVRIWHGGSVLLLK